MTASQHWIDELPEDCAERRLLNAGRIATSPQGSVDRSWQNFSVAIGTTAAVSLGTTKAVAATTLAAKAAAPITAASAAAPSALGGIGLALVTKAVAVGFAVGAVAIGVGTVVERLPSSPTSASTSVHVSALRQSPQVPSATASSSLSPSGAANAEEHAIELDGLPMHSVAPPYSLPIGVESSAVAREELRISPSSNVFNEGRGILRDEMASTSVVSSKGPSLAEQARELAQVKRLIDSGSTASAIARLEGMMNQNECGALSEERDALYVDALIQVTQKAKAQALASQFVARYPNSPHAAKMRKLAASE